MSIISFGIEEAIKAANQLATLQANRNLTDVEIAILRGAWEKLEYDQIAAQNKYATSYISQDAAPKLWKLLTSALGEKVRKSNFKEALRRNWESQQSEDPAPEKQFDKSSANSKITDSTDLERVLKEQSTVLPSSASSYASLYIGRPPIEATCLQALTQPGALIRIKAPKLMGKTLLAQRTLSQLSSQTSHTQPYRTVHLSFDMADRETHLTNLNKFLRWLCLNIARELDIPGDLNDVWDEEGIGAKVSCTAYFEEYLLAQSDSTDNAPLVLCLDNVDRLFPHPEVYEDFFGLLRSWYEKARNRPIWQRLRLMIVHSTDVYIRLNINQSPFNVGLAIELPEFSPQQAEQLAQGSGMSTTETPQLHALMDWVGGHPYLLGQAFTYLKNNLEANLSALIADSDMVIEIYQDHLRDQWVALTDQPALQEAFGQVVTADAPVQLDPIIAYQLQSLGLLKVVGNQVVVRCKLYKAYFAKHLG